MSIHFMFWACVWIGLTAAATLAGTLLWRILFRPTGGGAHEAPFHAESPAVAAGTVAVAHTVSQPPASDFPSLSRPAGETPPVRRRSGMQPPRWARPEQAAPARRVWEPTDYSVRNARHLDLMLRIAASCEPHGADVDAMFDGITANAFAPLAALTAGSS